MASSSQSDSGIISGINVTPLVDITLVLLIIFIVTAKILVTQAVPLDLPRSSHSEEVQLVLSVTVPKEGPSSINGRTVTADAAFVAMAKEVALGRPEVRAVIQADGAVPHRTVVHTLDLLRKAGVERIAFAALPEEPAP